MKNTKEFEEFKEFREISDENSNKSAPECPPFPPPPPDSIIELPGETKNVLCYTNTYPKKHFPPKGYSELEKKRRDAEIYF